MKMLWFCFNGIIIATSQAGVICLCTSTMHKGKAAFEIVPPMVTAGMTLASAERGNYVASGY
jgi:hypothetical protein